MKLVHQTQVQLKPKKKSMGAVQVDLHMFMLLDFVIESVLSVRCALRPKKQLTSENQQQRQCFLKGAI